MPDIFLSYNREDQAIARRFAETFQAEGLEVWWDTTLKTGEAYDEVTETALNEARAVVVLWSPRSVVSRWVRAEATQADRNKTLVPVTIEACRRPIMFELTQTADLSGWDGSPTNASWQAFLADVKRFVGSGAPEARPTAPKDPAPARAERLSVCVLPFANMSGDAEQEYFADGISEDIITDLSKVAALSVIARNTAFTFKGKSVEVPSVARQLGVSHVLEGSVRKAGNRVRITAQLIDGKAGDHLWADRWDRDLEDIFALQDEISEAIVGALKLKLLPNEKLEIEDRGKATADVYDAYLRARARANSVVSGEDFLSAAAEFRRILQIDPGFATARGDLVRLYYWACFYVPDHVEETAGHIERLAGEGLARAPDHWATHLANGLLLMLRRQWPEACAAFEQAIDLAPASVTDVRIAYAYCLQSLGRITECIAIHEAARVIDPLSRDTLVLMQSYWVVGRDDDMRAEYQRTLNLPGNREAQEHTLLWMIWETASPEEKQLQFQRYLEHRTVGMPVQAQVMELLGSPLQACELLREAFEDPANQDLTRLMFLGWYAALFGDDDLAVAALRRSSIGPVPFAVMTFWYPFLRRARQKPAFKQLVRDLGLYGAWRASGEWGDFARPVGDNDFEIIR
jgi:adenylate cyclase